MFIEINNKNYNSRYFSKIDKFDIIENEENKYCIKYTTESGGIIIEKFDNESLRNNKYTEMFNLNDSYGKIFETVSKLPNKGEDGKIYLVPSSNGMFDEYFWNKNNKWDKVGEVKVDLSNYYNKNEVDNKIKESLGFVNSELSKLTNIGGV